MGSPPVKQGPDRVAEVAELRGAVRAECTRLAGLVQRADALVRELGEPCGDYERLLLSAAEDSRAALRHALRHVERSAEQLRRADGFTREIAMGTRSVREAIGSRRGPAIAELTTAEALDLGLVHDDEVRW